MWLAFPLHLPPQMQNVGCYFQDFSLLLLSWVTSQKLAYLRLQTLTCGFSTILLYLLAALRIQRKLTSRVVNGVGEDIGNSVALLC